MFNNFFNVFYRGIAKPIRDKIKYSRIEIDHIFDINVGGFQFKMTFKDYPLDPYIIERIEGVREPETTIMMKSIVKKGFKVLELGGCYGYFTMILSKCVGSEGKVISVEGTPNTFDILKTNMELNKVENVEIYNYFITKKSKIFFEKNEINPYNAMKRNNSNLILKREYKEVQTIMLSDFLINQIKFIPDFIFMDIEGYEIFVLKDLLQNFITLKRAPIIAFETHEPFYKGKNLAYILQNLSNKGYYIRRARNILLFPNFV
ncbi:hypothetical protein LCGC14_1015680 [marine sediment metagenome]|uniref:Methyltransferase FkbM domain-containing protein n=1 Tax=marine sediment metagenome TaxID=412755 RepID=A0A0F9NKI5_9ZZZZ